MFIARIALSLGLAALSYYVGREVGRAQPVREALRRHREAQGRGEGSPR